MNCFLYQLRFNTPVHFGSPDSALSLYSSEDHVRSDTLFSALCHTAAQLFGNKGVEKLLNMVAHGDLILSDGMPWQGDTLYLPKPFYTVQTARELPAEKRKAIKKLAWIPTDRFEEYCKALTTGTLFECENVSFGRMIESTKAKVPDSSDAIPYPVGLFQFKENSGIYFLADCIDQEWLSQLITALGYSGLGGKVTSGYGKFSVVRAENLATGNDSQSQWLCRNLQRDSGKWMLLNSCLPKEGELEQALNGACYQLVRRSGFIAADGLNPSKKKTQHFLTAGSVVQNCFEGDLYSVGVTDTYTVYRYSKPLFLGVSL